MERSGAALLIALSLLACTACGSTEATGLDAAVAYEAHGIYRFWWGQLAQEAGIPTPFPAVTWYEVPGDGWKGDDGERTYGLWLPDGRIYLAEGLTLYEGAVKHEMLHELLRGDPQHTHPLFALYYSWRV